MSASRTDDSRRIDWSAVKGDALAAARYQVLRFVGGIRGERQGDVTRKQIGAWFHGTPPDFLNDAILDAIAREELRPCRTALVRRSNARHVYELTDKGREAVTTCSRGSCATTAPT